MRENRSDAECTPTTSDFSFDSYFNNHGDIQAAVQTFQV